MFLATDTLEVGTAIKSYFEVHHSWVPPVIVGAFTITNTIRIVAYVPQLIKAASDTNGASAISTLTWSLFFLSHLMTIAYALICLGNFVMALIFAGNAVACLAIVAVAVIKRKRHGDRSVAGLRSQATD